ncbi:MAG TPA: hypothetical protein PLE10_02915 [Brevefilum sp.]|nr:hypothetical protein [Brevefilum sp.]HPL68667.1 hypothetical protein [Brevefilum sp.]
MKVVCSQQNTRLEINAFFWVAKHHPVSEVCIDKGRADPPVCIATCIAEGSCSGGYRLGRLETNNRFSVSGIIIDTK